MFTPQPFSMKRMKKHVQRQFPNAKTMTEFFKQVFDGSDSLTLRSRTTQQRLEEAVRSPIKVALQDLVVVYNFLVDIHHRGQFISPGGSKEVPFPESECRGIWQAFKTWSRILSYPEGAAILYAVSSPFPDGRKFAKHLFSLMTELSFGEQVVKALDPIMEASLRN